MIRIFRLNFEVVSGCISDYILKFAWGDSIYILVYAKFKTFVIFFSDLTSPEGRILLFKSVPAVLFVFVLIFLSYCISIVFHLTPITPRESKNESNDVLMTQERTGEADVAVSADSDAVTVSLRGVVSFC